MTNRTELDKLLAIYERAVGMGNMKVAGKTLPEIVRSLVAFVEERTPDHVEATQELFEKAELNPPPCAPCDVSIPNNSELIEEFKTPVIASDGKHLGDYVIAHGAAEKAAAENGIDLNKEVKAAADKLLADYEDTITPEAKKLEDTAKAEQYGDDPEEVSSEEDVEKEEKPEIKAKAKKAPKAE